MANPTRQKHSIPALLPLLLVATLLACLTTTLSCSNKQKASSADDSTSETGDSPPPSPIPAPEKYTISGRIEVDIAVKRTNDLRILHTRKINRQAPGSFQIGEAAATPQQIYFGSAPPAKLRTNYQRIVRRLDKEKFSAINSRDSYDGAIETTSCASLDAHLVSNPLPEGRDGASHTLVCNKLFNEIFEELKVEENRNQVNYIRSIYQTAPVIDRENEQWDIDVLQLDRAWDIVEQNRQPLERPLVIAVIDTGVIEDHPELKPLGDRLVMGWDFYDNDNNPHDDGDDPMNPSFHGTHVLGTIAAVGEVQGKANEGTVGMLQDQEVIYLVIRAFGREGGTDFAIANALLYAVGLENSSGTVATYNGLPIKADIINMSFGGPGHSEFLDDAIETTHNQGALLVAAAGNENTNLQVFPAAHPLVIGTGSVTLMDSQATPIEDKGNAYQLELERAPYSNMGKNLDIMAPGGKTSQKKEHGILSAWYFKASLFGIEREEFSYIHYQGTSMAAPHIAAAAGLLKLVNPNLTNTGLHSLLVSTANSFKHGSTSERLDPFLYGEGILDLPVALDKASSFAQHNINLAVYILDTKTGEQVAQTEAKPGDFYTFTVTDLKPGTYTVIAGTEMKSPCVCDANQLCGSMDSQEQGDILLHPRQRQASVELNVSFNLDPEKNFCEIPPTDGDLI